MKYLIKLKNFFVSLVFPEVCLGCGTDNELLCYKCIAKIPIGSLDKNQKLLVVDEYIDQVWIVCDYDVQIVHDLVFAAKFYGSHDACRILGEIIWRFWDDYDISDYYKNKSFDLVPVPLHHIRKRQRGFNQSELIAKVVAEKVKMPVNNFLQRKRHTTQQVKLNADMRKQNVNNCFVTKQGGVPENCLLVDDVVTTGATINDAARALKQAGARCVNALIVAKH